MANPAARFLITADDRASRVIKKLRGEVTQTTGIVGKFATQFGLAFSAAAIGRNILDVALTTGKLRAQLETVTGSAERANLAFDKIAKFASETPYQIDQAATAFIKLAAYGIEPTDKLLRSLANTASAMGKGLDQAVEALADAAVGEFERLKEFGIKASSEGDKVAFTFRGVTTEVGKNAEEITAYLQNIGETDFAGAAERQMNTLGGAISNLQDSVFQLTDKFASESGLTASIAAASREISALINNANQGSLSLTKFGHGIGIALGQFQVGSDISVLAQRRKSIEEIDASIERLQGKINNRRNNVRARQENAELQRKIDLLKENRRVLVASLSDPDFISQSNRLVAQREKPAAPAGELGRVTPETRGAQNAASAVAKQNKAAAAAAKAARDAQAALNRILAEGKTLTESLYTPQEAYNAQIANLNRLREAGAITQETYNRAVIDYQSQLDEATGKTQALLAAEQQLATDRERAMDLIGELDTGSAIRDQIIEVQRLAATFPELADSLAEVEFNLQEKWDAIGDQAAEAAEKTKSAWEELGPTFSSAFEDAIVEGKKFSDVLKGLEQDIIRIITRKAVTEPLGNAISGAFGGSGGFLDGIFGSLFGGARATGGPVTAGMGYLVGEQGPELFMPGQSGQIIPASRTQQAVGNTFNFSFALPADTVDYRRAGQQVAREASRYLQTAMGAV